MLFEVFLFKLFVGALATAAVVGAISYAVIKSWYKTHAISGETVELLKKELPNAVHIQANIRGSRGDVRLTNSWQSEAIDAETQAAFAGRSRITLKV